MKEAYDIQINYLVLLCSDRPMPSFLVSVLRPHFSHPLLLHCFLFLLRLTSVLMASGLFPNLPRKCSGDNMVPSWRKSASFSWSVSVVAEMPASGPRLGREPAASEGSGICPGIMSDPAATAAVGRKTEGEGNDKEERKERFETNYKTCCSSKKWEAQWILQLFIVHSISELNYHITVYFWISMKYKLMYQTSKYTVYVLYGVVYYGLLLLAFILKNLHLLSSTDKDRGLLFPRMLSDVDSCVIFLVSSRWKSKLHTVCSSTLISVASHEKTSHESFYLITWTGSSPLPSLLVASRAAFRLDVHSTFENDVKRTWNASASKCSE